MLVYIWMLLIKKLINSRASTRFRIDTLERISKRMVEYGGRSTGKLWLLFSDSYVRMERWCRLMLALRYAQWLKNHRLHRVVHLQPWRLIQVNEILLSTPPLQKAIEWGAQFLALYNRDGYTLPVLLRSQLPGLTGANRGLSYGHPRSSSRVDSSRRNQQFFYQAQPRNLEVKV